MTAIDKQRVASPELQAAIQPDGSLYDVLWYLEWRVGNDEATLDGGFTAQQLREIADHMDAKRGPVPGETSQ